MSTPYEWDDMLIPPQARGDRVTPNVTDELAAYLPQRPAAYPLVSSDRFGTEAGVDRREEDAEDTRARLRWGPFAKIYKENDTSAFKRVHGGSAAPLAYPGKFIARAAGPPRSCRQAPGERT
ncbi:MULTISPECIES: hypothetical protein [unclassified Streptomyces]|uniref:hypothetical protein n=1 Tax=unclassified Streptomyces TaxID=2593676 RepID=UPI003808A608